MDFELTQDQQIFYDSVKRFAVNELGDGAVDRANSDGYLWDVAARFAEIRSRLTTDHVCARLQADPATLKRFDIESLGVIKFSFIRPVVQGSRFDRDMHGAQLGVLFAEMDI